MGKKKHCSNCTYIDPDNQQCDRDPSCKLEYWEPEEEEGKNGCIALSLLDERIGELEKWKNDKTKIVDPDELADRIKKAK